jgi:hypothetical protein
MDGIARQTTPHRIHALTTGQRLSLGPAK